MAKEITSEEVNLLDKYFRAANYLSACQLYLLDNPLLKKPLSKKDIKKKIVGHWGTVPAQNFVYTHLNRVIKKYDLDIDSYFKHQINQIKKSENLVLKLFEKKKLDSIVNKIIKAINEENPKFIYSAPITQRLFTSIISLYY